jgi:hypothetical protein
MRREDSPLPEAKAECAPAHSVTWSAAAKLAASRPAAKLVSVAERVEAEGFTAVVATVADAINKAPMSRVRI